MGFVRILGALAIGVLSSGPLVAQEPSAAPPADSAPADSTPAASDALPVEQARLADRFKRLEEVIGRLAELSASTDPRRAKLLREAISRSREQDVTSRFESIVKLLEDERLSAAATNQTELQGELDQLLTLLLQADRDKELSSQRDRVREYLKEVGRLIRTQKGIKARTEGGDELKPLGEDQQQAADDTAKLGGKISTTESQAKGNEKPAGEKGDEQSGENGKQQEGDDGDQKSDDNPKPEGADSKPSDNQTPGEPSDSSKPGEPSTGSESQPGSPSESQGQPSQPQNPSPGQPGQPGQPSDGNQQQNQQQAPQDPADRAAQRLQAAQQQMEQAQKKLEEAERKGASEHQREALRALEQAKAELERILRQLREEELERTLTQLAVRFKKMLEWQIQVYEGTLRLNEVPAADRDHDDEIAATALSRQEADIHREADKALLVLREEGSSVAFPETVMQIRDDAAHVAKWLAAVDVGKLTQGVEEDIISALEEMIAALEKAIKDLENKRTPPGQQASAGQPAEPPLVDKLAELKMIRALQMRINQRTQRFGKMIEEEEAEDSAILEALKDLAERQERVHRATSDLQKGRND